MHLRRGLALRFEHLRVGDEDAEALGARCSDVEPVGL